jgi:hypothetical protein
MTMPTMSRSAAGRPKRSDVLSMTAKFGPGLINARVNAPQKASRMGRVLIALLRNRARRLRRMFACVERCAG